MIINPTIANTKNNLPQMIYSLEQRKNIPITRHGKIVAYLISSREYESLKNMKKKFSTEWKELRKSKDFKKFSITESEVQSWREKSSGRDISF
jgi:prevent-host-death family protein